MATAEVPTRPVIYRLAEITAEVHSLAQRRDIVVFVRVGDYYRVVGDGAEAIGRTTGREVKPVRGIPAVTVTHADLERTIQTMIVAGYRTVTAVLDAS